jgi:predicted kinase
VTATGRQAGVVPGPRFVVVSGPPGSGKTTLAAGVAARLQLPLFSKDTVKEALMSVLDVPDVATSQRLGAAAVAAIIAVARASGRGVLESNWRASIARRELAQLDGPVVEVFCDCDPALSRSRFIARVGTRPAGHLDADRRDDNSLWSGEALEPVDGGWPVVRVDTSTAVELEDVLDRIARALPPAST